MIFGFGYQFFRSEILGEAGTMMDMHSGPIQILLELGVFGFVLFVGMIVGPLRAIMRSGSTDRTISVTMFSGCVGFIVSQFLDNAVFTPLTGVVFVILIALCARPELFQSAVLKTWWGGPNEAQPCPEDAPATLQS